MEDPAVTYDLAVTGNIMSLVIRFCMKKQVVGLFTVIIGCKKVILRKLIKLNKSSNNL
jgi:hypothetical protein